MEGNIATQDDTIIQGTFSGDGGADTGYTIISDLYIVTNVDFIHQEIAIAYFGSIPTESSSTDNYVFADMVVIPDNQWTFFSFVVEILWFCS